VANNIAYGRAVVGCRNGTAGSCYVKDMELYVEIAVDFDVSVTVHHIYK